jgi:excisionase family DNA binding protein
MSTKKEDTALKPGSLKYAAAKLGCSLPTLYELMATGTLRSYHIGRAHRVSDQAISDCIALLEREESEHCISRLPTLRRDVHHPDDHRASLWSLQRPRSM